MAKNQIYLFVGAGCLLAYCAVVALLAGLFFFTPVFGNRVFAPTPDLVSAESNTRPNRDGNSMGDADAPIHIVEFGDFQCPFCKRFHTETEPLLISDYIETGKVQFTYRSAGNWVSNHVSGNTESQDAALTAYCAADQNKFWEMHAALFANNRDVENQGAFASERLAAMAEHIGLDMTVFRDCYDNGKHADQVQKDYADAIAAGVQGTPSFVVTYTINGVTQTFLIEGAQRYEVFQQRLDSVLKEIGQ